MSRLQTPVRSRCIRRRISVRAGVALIGLLAAALLVAAAPSGRRAYAQDGDATAADAKYGVVEVTGDEVNLRAGPSIDHHDVGQVSRGQLLFELQRDGEFVRVRVPGGVPVYVFGSLLEWDGPTERTTEGERSQVTRGALRCRVAADDVLMRATPTTGHYPLHDQKLQRDAELIVIAAEETAKGRWLRVIAPPTTHVWIHERYVRRSEPQPELSVLAKAAEERLDALTGGRTRTEREAGATERAQAFAKRVAAIKVKVDSGACDTEVESAARALAAEAENVDQRVGALALVERIVGLREQRDARAAADAEKAARDIAEARRRQAEQQAELEEQRRRREAEERAREEAERQRRLSGRGTPTATGVVRVRGTSAWLETAGGGRLDLRSRKFRLADFAGRSVRVWGTRHERSGESARVDVTSIEIVPTE